MKTGKFFRPGLAALGALALTACMGTRHVGYDKPATDMPGGSRTVQFELSRDFYAAAPDCVTVLPVNEPKGANTSLARTLEDALARYLKERVTLVIDRMERERLVRELAVDLTHAGDRRAYAHAARCPYFLYSRPWGQGEAAYLLFWTQSAVGVEASLGDASGEKPLWKARHVAKRSDGGIPLSPLSAAVSIFNATKLSQDGDVALSLADDAARRILGTLPEIRRSRLSSLAN